MTRIDITGDRLQVEVLGWDKLWSFKSRLDFPMEHVIGARRWNEENDSGWRGIRAPGTSLPGVIIAGTYHGKGEHVFYDVHDFSNAIVIELKNEWYARLVVEVEEAKEIMLLMARVAEAHA